MLVYLHFILEEEEKKVDATSIFFTILNIEVTVLGQKNSVVVVGLFDHISKWLNHCQKSLIVVSKFNHTNFLKCIFQFTWILPTMVFTNYHCLLHRELNC